MSTYTPPYQLTDAILRLSTEIAATVKEITVRGNLSAQPQLRPRRAQGRTETPAGDSVFFFSFLSPP